MSVEQLFLNVPQWQIINEPLNQDPLNALKQDSALQREIAAGKRCAVARIWENPQCLVVTRRETRFPQFDDACAQLAGKGWPVLVRESGGTCVPHQPGILHFSLIYPQATPRSKRLDDAYEALCEPIRRALIKLGLTPEYGETEGSYCDGNFNININGLKITGTAQRIVGAPANCENESVKSAVLAQAMIVVDADAEAGTEWVNRFYQYAGNERRFDPTVATSVKAQLPSSLIFPTNFTNYFRDLLVEALKELI